ncbi:putative histidine kinase [Fimbriimonas ginsengisoli Gsoil 348]|uniref:histidine kinase n=2 Tax=Fimbriimonas ginsengisoli TaxID=1005039 RepID=A0A068NM15_FIMGI|nr:response regulator [Fimbriimonas ginsengisoli]AIE84573.1 putative histidine kinase [Fimbriimonas ginsengisoli Gsoil 348]
MHDLRTPLHQIIGYSELLVEQAEAEGEPAYLPDLVRIRSAGRQLLGLLEGSTISELPPLPLATAHAPAAPRAARPREDSSLVLVVDDIEVNRDVLCRRIEREGHRIEVATNGIEAMEVLRSRAFDLVLLDIMMPLMDGYQVLESMKADPELSHIPVIMISALDEEESVVRCIEMGAEDYLCKPFHPTLLRARMGACLARKRAHDRERSLTEQLQQNLTRLQDLERLRDDLTHMVVHDLRTPLTSLIAGMQSMDGVGDLNDDQREMMQIAIDGGATLLGMVNDLLEVSQMEAGSMQLEYGEVDPYALIAEATAQVASLLQGKGLRLVTELSPGLSPFRGDESKLRRILVNLLGNAIKFTPSNAEITVAIRQTDDSAGLLFSIRDHGEGIPAEAFERIFEKFGQVESRKNGRKMSTGLGLTFCKLATEAHGGNIGVESMPGIGSTFFFTIPKGNIPLAANGT